MTRTISGTVISDVRFCFPFRMILAGSSESGKTRFAGDMLKRKDLFQENPTSIIYYYPCYLEKAPVNWHHSLSIPVSYQIGLPSKNDLLQLPNGACVVLDDSYDMAINSSAVDHLFRVISGKKKIAVIIMTQNNFSKGKYGREIRNSCNFAVLFRNCCDTSINENVARMAGLKKAYDAASHDLEGVMYPHILLDQSQQGQLSPYRLYTRIFDQFKIAYSVNGMKGYVVGAPDFESVFQVISDSKTFSAKINAAKEDREITPSATITKKCRKQLPLEICYPESDVQSSTDTSEESSEHARTRTNEDTSSTGSTSPTRNCTSSKRKRSCSGSSDGASKQSKFTTKRLLRWKQRNGRTLHKNQKHT